MKLSNNWKEVPYDKDGFVEFDLIKDKLVNLLIRYESDYETEIEFVYEVMSQNDFKVNGFMATHYMLINID